MCLAIPGELIETRETGGLRIGKVRFGGITRDTCLAFVPEAGPGDYVLVHAGFAISRINEAEAARTLALLEGAGLVAEQLGPEPIP